MCLFHEEEFSLYFFRKELYSTMYSACICNKGAQNVDNELISSLLHLPLRNSPFVKDFNLAIDGDGSGTLINEVGGNK